MRRHGAENRKGHVENRKKEIIAMDRKTEIMVSLGVAVGANCIPCFDHLYARAREVELDDEDIRAVADIAFKVKNGAVMFMKNAVNEVVDMPAADEAACSCPATGTCN